MVVTLRSPTIYLDGVVMCENNRFNPELSTLAKVLYTFRPAVCKATEGEIWSKCC